MGEWKEYVLEDVIEKFIDYRGKTPKKTTIGVPLVTAKIVKAGRILEPNEFIAESDYDLWMTRGLPEIDDVVLTTEAPLGEVALIKNKKIALAQRIITLRGKKTYAHNPFLKYYFQSGTGQYELESRASGTTVFGIKAAVLRKMPIILPSLPEQKSIASVLSSLDDKIDLLHRQNKTLEAMAETLFRQWFVEKAQEDWEKKTLADYAVHIKVSVKPASNPMKIYTHYSLPAFDNGMRPVNEIGSEILSNKYSVKPWTILVSKLNPRFPRIWAIGNTPGENAICSTEFQVFKPTNMKLYGYLYYLLKSNDAREELAMAASGTSGSHQRVRPEDILNIKSSTPSITLAEQYSELMMPGINKLMANLEQIHSLEKLRDTLLPKLMSGEVRMDYTEDAA
ncbi:MAG: restriction endonuclease subunit S [Gammaproteobacteria bacterium]|nr:restriction endonuclease subunit S [Gammaproteobacteria bacterium]